VPQVGIELGNCNVVARKMYNIKFCNRCVFSIICFEEKW